MRPSGSSANPAAARRRSAELMLALEPLTSGELTVDGHRLSRLSIRQERDYRRAVQAVFQDPYGSLNPRHEVLRRSIGEPLTVQHRLGRAELRERVARAARHRRAAARQRTISTRTSSAAASASASPSPARSRAAAALPGARRAGLGARRVDPRADPEPAARAAGAVGADLPVHRPRPRGGRAS